MGLHSLRAVLYSSLMRLFSALALALASALLSDLASLRVPGPPGAAVEPRTVSLALAGAVDFCVSGVVPLSWAIAPAAIKAPAMPITQARRFMFASFGL